MEHWLKEISCKFQVIWTFLDSIIFQKILVFLSYFKTYITINKNAGKEMMGNIFSDSTHHPICYVSQFSHNLNVCSKFGISLWSSYMKHLHELLFLMLAKKFYRYTVCLYPKGPKKITFRLVSIPRFHDFSEIFDVLLLT